MKKPLLCALLGAAALLGGAPARAQQKPAHWCATDEHNAALRASFHDPVLEAERRNAEFLSERMQSDDVFAQQFQNRTNNRRIVPMVIHVVTRCGQQTLDEAAIARGVDQLNRDWLRRNADTTQTPLVFQPYAASMDLEFRLAKIDPQGNATTGIHRVSNVATNAVTPRDLIKTYVPYWPNYFNVWLVDAIDGGGGGGVILGYGQFPGTGPWNTWGFVMRYDTWTGAWGSNDRTAAHEIGHCFNLYHTFQGSCGNSCATSGDMVCDTSPSASASEPCGSRNTCSNDVGPGSPYTSNVIDQDANYMSYNNCQNMFTLGQKTRVDAAINSFSYIQNMMSPANLLATGVADGQVVPPAPPVAYVATCQLGSFAGETSACQGRPTTFVNASYGAPITSYNWTFSNALPAVDTTANPTVIFTSPGLQTVTLTVTGPTGTSAPLTFNVNVVPAGQVAPVQESFETPGIDSIYRSTTSSTSQRWIWANVPNTDVTSLTASHGQRAFYVANGRQAAGTINTLNTPSFDTRGMSANPAPRLKFDIAYSMRNGSAADELRVFLSADCGRTWQVRYTKIGSALNTTGTRQISAFVPTMTSQWRTDSITLTNQYLNQPSVLVRFEATSQGSNGNNLYLDNLRIGSTPLGLAPNMEAAGVSLAPNPLTDETALNFSLANATRVAVRVSDVLGRPVLFVPEQTLQAGEHMVPLAEQLRQQSAGLYVVTVMLDGKPYTQKLLVQ